MTRSYCVVFTDFRLRNRNKKFRMRGMSRLCPIIRLIL